MGRLPYRSRALGTVMAATAGEIIGSVGAGDAFCAGLLYGSHERWPLTASLQLATPAPAPACRPPMRSTAPKRP